MFFRATRSWAEVFVLVVALSVSTGSSASAQVTDLTAIHQAGQTFLTWTELGGSGVEYRVYRSDAAITVIDGSVTLLGTVGNGTSENVRVSMLDGSPNFFTITDLGSPLAPSDGLYVHTVASDGSSFYAVTPMIGGLEDMTLVPGVNALSAAVAETVASPRPVLQSVNGSIRHYVHWVSDHDTPLTPAMWNRPSRAFNLRVVFDPSFSGLRPILLRLHARGGNFRLPGDFVHPEAVVVSPDDWIGELPQNTFWYGMNEAFPDTTQYATHLNVDYTVRRVMAELDFVMGDPFFSVDATRVYAMGSSMGALGSMFLAYRFPARFAAVHLTVPKFDFGCSENQCWLEPQNGDLLWGPAAANLPTTDGIGVYDRLDIGFLVSASPEVDFPQVYAVNGRNDVVVGWPEKPPTYAAVATARQPAEFFWDEREHDGTGAQWAFVMNQRRLGMWDLRIDRSIPAFANLSIDDDPGDGNPLVGDAVGTINGRLEWSVASLVDTPLMHAGDFALRDTLAMDDSPVPNATVDWTPRRLQSFPRVPGQVYRFRNLQQPGGVEVENRAVVADSLGVITVVDAIVTQAGNRFVLEVLAGPNEFRRGDVNQDASTNIGDAISLLAFLFGTGPDPSCRAAADVNDDDQLDISDPIALLGFQFSLGPPPPAPGPVSCGPDATPGALDCATYPCP